jgi:hypothetical protein
MPTRTGLFRTARLIATAGLALLVTACEHGPTGVGVVATITVERNPDTLTVLSARQMQAVGRDADGNVVAISPTWSVVQGGGSINATGVFTAGSELGTFANTVRATVGSISGVGTMVVVSGLGASVQVTPSPVTLAIGATQQFTAVFRDANGNVVTNAVPTWTVASGGTISPSGLFTAGTTAGSFPNTVVARLGELAGTATVTVTAGPLANIVVSPDPRTMAIGTTQQFVAVGYDAFNNILPITPTWSMQNGGGTIGSTGMVTAGTTSGTFTNTVRACATALCPAGSPSGFATVLVSAGTLASITVTPNPVNVVTEERQQFTAVGRDASGNIVAIAPVWSMRAGLAGGVVLSGGGYQAPTAVGPGIDTVIATVGAIAGRARINVIASSALATITVTPNPANVAVGGLQTFTATGRDISGNIVPTPGLSWAVVAGGGTIIPTTGAFTAGTASGTFANTVEARVGALFGTATVVVTPGALVSVTVSPNPRTLATGATQQFTAEGRDAFNNVVPFTPSWSIQASGGTINATTGLFTAGNVAGTFPNTVRACATLACAAGVPRGFATVSVTPGVLANISVTPNPVNVGTGATQQFTAVGTDANGNVVAITPVWSMQPGGAGGTVLPSGGYQAPAVVGVGVDTVVATVGAIAGRARINVIASTALVSIAVTPNPANVGTGAIQDFTATGFDISGLVVPTPGLAWSVVAGGGTINSTTGRFTAGTTTGTFANTIRATSGTTSGFATVVVTTVIPPAGNILGAAATHGILAGTEVTCAGAPSAISADVSVWPGTAISGFPPCTLTGLRNAGTTYAQTAQTDLTSAYLALAAMPCGTTITSDLGGTTLTPGVYCAGGSVGVTGVVTLDGPAGSVFVIRAGTSLTTAGSVVLTGGVTAESVYWWTGSSATLGSGSAWQGNILSLTSISLIDGVTLTGRALARNGAVTLGVGSFINLP